MSEYWAGGRIRARSRHWVGVWVAACSDLRQSHLSADEDYRSSGFLTSDSVLQYVTVLSHAGSSVLSVLAHLYEVVPGPAWVRTGLPVLIYSSNSKSPRCSWNGFLQ